jgi:hypothetical protein
MKPLKKITVIFLLLLGAMPSLYAVFFLAQQWHIRHQMLERLEKEHLHELTIAKKDFTWYKPGKEIKINGALFDVKEIKEAGDNIIVKGIYDDEEKQLHNQLSKLIKKGGQNSAPNQSFTKVFTQLTGITHSFQWQLSPSESLIENIFLQFSSRLTETEIVVFTPPPQV